MSVPVSPDVFIETRSIGYGHGTFHRLGNVTFNMMFESLSKCQMIHQPRMLKRNKRFSHFCPVHGGVLVDSISCDSNTIILCHDDVAPVLMLNNPGTFCIVLSYEEKVPEWVEGNGWENRCIFIKREKRFYEYAAMLEALFRDNLIWECEMDHAVYSHARFDDLIEASEEQLNGFVSIFDSGYSLIACSKKTPPPDEFSKYIVENRSLSEFDIEFIESNIITRVDRKSQLVICRHAKFAPYASLQFPVFIDNEHVFHCILVCNTEGIEATIDRYFSFIRRVVNICSDWWKNSVILNSPWHRVLLCLIEGEDRTPSYLETQLAGTSIPKAKQFRLMKIEFPESMPFQERSKVLESARDLNEGSCYPFMKDDALLVLCYSLSENEAALSGRHVWNSCHDNIFVPYGLVTGCSQMFNNIEDIDIAYKQATIACNLSSAEMREVCFMEPEREVVCYPFEHALKFYLMQEERDPEIVEYSFRHCILRRLFEEDKANDTNITELLWVYLLNERNATETSKQIFVHRNTVLYHVARLEKRFDFSFDSPALRSRIMLDYYNMFANEAGRK